VYGIQRDERGISSLGQGRQDREGQTGRTDRQGKADRERQDKVKRCRGYSRAEEAGGPGGTTGILVWFFEGRVANQRRVRVGYRWGIGGGTAVSQTEGLISRVLVLVLVE
jgi:hypothetical protein